MPKVWLPVALIVMLFFWGMLITPFLDIFQGDAELEADSYPLLMVGLARVKGVLFSFNSTFGTFTGLPLVSCSTA